MMKASKQELFELLKTDTSDLERLKSVNISF